MWSNLTRDDLEQVRTELKRRREATLRRQAEELRGLSTEWAGVETLYQLIDDFTRKFEQMPAAAAEPVIVVERAAKETPPASHPPASHPKDQRPPPETRHPHRRHHGESNFETFARAVSRSI